MSRVTAGARPRRHLPVGPPVVSTHQGRLGADANGYRNGYNGLRYVNGTRINGTRFVNGRRVTVYIGGRLAAVGRTVSILLMSTRVAKTTRLSSLLT
jgi:hypothetical protein